MHKGIPSTAMVKLLILDCCLWWDSCSIPLQAGGGKKAVSLVHTCTSGSPQETALTNGGLVIYAQCVWLLADTLITWHVTTAIMTSKRLVGFRGYPAFINVFSASWVNFFIWPHVGGIASLVRKVKLLCIVSSSNFWTRGLTIADSDQSCLGPKPVIINRNESIPSSQIY